MDDTPLEEILHQAGEVDENTEMESGDVDQLAAAYNLPTDDDNGPRILGEGTVAVGTDEEI